MTISYGKDLFGDDNRVIVIPTNCVGAQGAGLAKLAKLRWPEWDQWYTRVCKTGHVTPGQVRMFCGRVAEPVIMKRPIVLSVATKDHWRNPSQVEWVERGLKGIEATLVLALSQRESGPVLHGRNPLGQGTRVGIPAIGCGYGEMSYEVVRPKIEATAGVLSALGYVVRLYEPRK